MSKAPEARAVPSVTELLRQHARNAGDEMALRFEGRTSTFSELDFQVARVAAALIALALQEGDRVGYLGKNSDSYFHLLYACAGIGAVMVPIGWRLAPDEIEYIMMDAAVGVVFVDEFLKPTVASLRQSLPKLETIVSMDGRGFDAYDRWVATAAGQEAIGDEARRDDSSDRVFLQLYTSGTTGRPKGVLLNGRNIFSVRSQLEDEQVEWAHCGSGDVMLVAMPIAHIGGTGYGLAALFHGADALVMREFTPAAMLNAIRDEKVAQFFAVPAALQIMLQEPNVRHIDFSGIKHILYGASPMPLPVLRQAMEVFGAGMVQLYGMTETSGTIVALDAEHHDPAGNERMKSAGQPLPGVEIKIVDPSGRTLGSREIGEIYTRSEANMVGYWRLEEETAATLDSAGWVHTGDAGYLDEGGFLFIYDRLKDMICSGAENVYAAEVENVLCEHPDIADVAVIGVPDDKWGEAVKAVAVARPGRTINEGAVIEWARKSLAGFKLPKSIDVVEALPRGATGKVLKLALRAPYWTGRDRQVN